MEEIEPGDLFVRPARSPEDVSSALSVGDVTQLLEERYRAERVDAVFYGQSRRRRLAEREVAGWENRFYNVWSLPWRAFYAPLEEEPGLFRTFASIDPSPEGIMAFAGRYGNLMDTCPTLVWQEEVLAMRRAICVWELLRKNRFAELLRHFKFRPLTEEMWDVYLDLYYESLWGILRHQYYIRVLHDAGNNFLNRREFAALTDLPTRQELFEMPTIRGVYQLAVFSTPS